MDTCLIIIWIIWSSHFCITNKFRFGPPCQSFIYCFLIKMKKCSTWWMIPFIFSFDFNPIFIDIFIFLRILFFYLLRIHYALLQRTLSILLRMKLIQIHPLFWRLKFSLRIKQCFLH
jgi:hypothetical protein